MTKYRKGKHQIIQHTTIRQLVLSNWKLILLLFFCIHTVYV